MTNVDRGKLFRATLLGLALGTASCTHSEASVKEKSAEVASTSNWSRVASCGSGSGHYALPRESSTRGRETMSGSMVLYRNGRTLLGAFSLDSAFDVREKGLGSLSEHANDADRNYVYVNVTATCSRRFERNRMPKKILEVEDHEREDDLENIVGLSDRDPSRPEMQSLDYISILLESTSATSTYYGRPGEGCVFDAHSLLDLESELPSCPGPLPELDSVQIYTTRQPKL